MNRKDFVDKTVFDYSPETFSVVKNTLIGEYLSFSFIDENDITKHMLSEKVCDYFEKLELRTGKGFDKHLDYYFKALDEIVRPRIAEIPKQKKGAPAPEEPRAHKYYVKASSIKESRSISIRQLLDYTRYMMCLYSAIIKNDYKTIENFDFSINSLNIEKIISSMKKEKNTGLLHLGKGNLFNTEELYSEDTGIFIYTIILLNALMDESVKES